MTMIVYWVEYVDGQPIPYCQEFQEEQKQIEKSLALCSQLRADKKKHVCISSEFTNHAGEMGVDGVKDGKLPDGRDYTWKKRRI
jgi:hypothetical protein